MHITLWQGCFAIMQGRNEGSLLSPPEDDYADEKNNGMTLYRYLIHFNLFHFAEDESSLYIVAMILWSHRPITRHVKASPPTSFSYKFSIGH